MPERQSNLCVIGMAGREALPLGHALMARWGFKHPAGIARLLKSGASWTQVQAATGCSRATIEDNQAGRLVGSLRLAQLRDGTGTPGVIQPW
jgi:hypothetical protein